MSFTKMNAALNSHLVSVLGTKKLVGFSRVNFGRVKHTIALEGRQLLKCFSFIVDNTSKDVSAVQRNTLMRYEDGVPHVSGPVENRPLPQTIFQATWNRATNKLALQDGNTRVMDALKNIDKEFFQEVTLEVYEVDSQEEAKAIYDCFDSRASVKQGKHDVQSLFRAADVLEHLKSLRMRRSDSMVTPLKLLTKKNTFKALSPSDVGSYLSTLQYTDSVLLQLEGVDHNVPAREVTAVFGGGELAGIMLFHSENYRDPANTPYMAMLQQHVADTLIHAITRQPYTTPFTAFHAEYLSATEHLGRSGSKVVPERAKHFQAAMHRYLESMKARGAAVVATPRKASGARSRAV
jgi:hypothetical protein